jgi:cyclophilin family peptidyl-prolyl cis-trans isomerase
VSFFSLVPVLAVTALLAGGCGGDDEGSSGPSVTEDVAAGGAGCRQADPPRRKPDGGQRREAPLLDPARTYDVVFRTSCGSFTVRLDVNRSPRTTASFAALVRRRFFDDTGIHRIVPGFAFQGGDPTGTGRGGPGYSTVEPPPKSVKYRAGVVAMAKTPKERAGTGGSQFFVVTAGQPKLRPQFAILGRVTRGLQVTRRIGELGDRESGARGIPTQVVLIDSARLRVSGGHAGHAEPGSKDRRGRLSCGPDDACPEG